jgi:predicted RecB family nuclease
MLPYVSRVRELAESDLNTLVQGDRSLIAGIGASSLLRFHARARLQVQPGAKPYLIENAHFPHAELELFFDIETDPMRDICYLHGFVERRNRDNDTERYIPFFVDDPTPEQEETAFAEAWAYLQASMPCVIYYYSPYERTWWRKLQRKYPDVATEEEVEEVFSHATAVDLYQDVVRPRMEWPTRDYSIKTLATFLGFNWRDKHPSGAASIEWYHRWVEGGDPAIRNRILDYNQDDCVAMRVLLDEISRLSSV